MHDFCYVSKKEAAPVKAELLDIIHEVQDIVRDDFTFQFTFIGSSSRNMITYDRKSNIGFDFDVNIEVNDYDENYEPKEIRTIIRKALDILFKELACLFELESATMPKLRTIKGALKEIKATDPESVMTDYKIRWLIKSGRLRSYAVGTREIIVMESFDDENLLTQESREGCNITQGIKLSEQYGELLTKTTQSYTCTRRR